jgi:TPR repeat protein|tara:strand:+ start:810 stop:1406 length:597 start_codon:yes stop_codon:yes gene_type:complete
MGINWPVLTLTCALFFSHGWAHGASLDKGLEAYQAGDFKTALAQWLLFAEQGNASAQSNLALMYEHGKGVVQNHQSAVHWYTLAAEQGEAVAQANLGAMYDTGRGVAENDSTAIKWLNLAAAQGYAHAQAYLGVMYVNGEGVTADYLRAYMWWSLAADNGDQPSAQYKQSIASKMSPDHLIKAQQMATKCFNSGYDDC